MRSIFIVAGIGPWVFAEHAAHAVGVESNNEVTRMKRAICILVLATASMCAAQTNTGVLSGDCKDVASYIVDYFGLSNKPVVTSSAAERTVTMIYLKPDKLSVMLLLLPKGVCAGKVTAVNHSAEGPLVNALKARFHK